MKTIIVAALAVVGGLAAGVFLGLLYADVINAAALKAAITEPGGGWSEPVWLN